jgi:hypothetical protein
MLAFAFSILLGLSACNNRSDQQLQRQLQGTWTLQVTNPTGDEFKSATYVSPAGFYTSRITLTRTGASNAVYNDELEGSWRIENGVLIDTTTRHSNTNFSPHQRMVWRARIVRFTENEFVVEQDGTNEWTSSLKQIAFRRSGN